MGGCSVHRLPSHCVLNMILSVEGSWCFDVTIFVDFGFDLCSTSKARKVNKPTEEDSPLVTPGSRQGQRKDTRKLTNHIKVLKSRLSTCEIEVIREAIIL